MTVHPTGSTRSKIIKNFDPALVNMITKKIDSKSYKGRMLHCRPHVPVSPDKKENQVEIGKDDTDQKDVLKKQESNNPGLVEAELSPVKDKKEIESKKSEETDTSKSTIPGLSLKDIEKAKKKKNDKSKKEAKKKEEKQNQTKNKEKDKKVDELTQHDFMNSTTKDEKLADFVFDSFPDSEEEVFEDSVEALPNDDIATFLTPKPFKSFFAQQVEVLRPSPSVTPKRPSSVAGLSPIETAENAKKVKPIRSSLPRIC